VQRVAEIGEELAQPKWKVAAVANELAVTRQQSVHARNSILA
jgi:hypothetical protein